MLFESKLDQLHLAVKTNRWHWYFYLFCRISLAIGFAIAGMVKIQGERFASGLSEIHPMGSYLEALHHTGYYYTFIGIAQVLAALLLLFNRTVLLGALIYFPTILNIWILSLAVRFDGSAVSSTWMVLANLYLIAWNYDRWKFIFHKHGPLNPDFSKMSLKSSKFPFLFFGAAISTLGITLLIFLFGYDIKPRNTLSYCQQQFESKENEEIGNRFCDCIHIQGNPLDSCLKNYETELEKLATSN